DVRMVLTEQTDLSQYMATMEPANTAKESALFYNVDQTRTAKPQGYPEDETTTPNTAVARLNAREPDRRIGPSIILKVMAGDTLQAAVRGYYHQQGTAPDQPSIPAEEMVSSLLAALPGLAGPADPGHQASAFGAGRDQGPRFTAGDLQQLKEKDPQTVNNQKPRAYLNYVFFDNQLNFVEEGSGVKQVQAEPDVLETLSSGQVVAKKSGYVYVYTSNESQQDVLFDNLVVTQSTGPILEETHYYPFGQTMAGISTLAPLRLENRFKYNGKELNHLEFSDGVGLDIYDYGFRNYDPQIGRFIEQDPITDNLATLSPYQYAANDPIANIDVDGLVPFGIPCPGTSSLAIFFEKVGAGISQFANSPLARALSISIHTLQDAGMIQNAISTSNMINNAFTAVGVGIVSKTGNTGGSWPHPIHIRSFAPYETFGGGFEGDSRGYSTALGLGEGGSVTSRVQYAFSVDPSARTFNVGHVWSNESRHPILGTANATPNDKANITGFSSSMDKEGNSTVSFTANLSAANPLTEPLSPDIDVHTKFTLTENERKGTLNVNVVQTGDAFPSAEVFIGDTNGNQLFIGVSPAMGNPYTSLRGDNHRPMISVKFTVTMDKKGVFTSVIQGNKTYTLNQWKKLMQSQPTTK
ncbi:RHS repeat-associated core domain-containing protein, partial [Compostibacter hankyongensis]|uniref:RHS repeat-associated core domain-containing protein n=1 Tax=Compostibacter hankyongensis TaxID=1007089 RepID=UPI0031EF8B69